MASNITLPTDELNMLIRGDIDVINGYDLSTGTGTIHVRDGGLYVEGLTDLDQTTITTDDGKFHVVGTNIVEFSTSGVEMTGVGASFLTTTAGLLTLSSSATDANGKILIQAAGTGADSILLDASNALSGQIHLQSAGGSDTVDSIQLVATDTTEGNVLIQGNGGTTLPSVKVSATNATNGQVVIESDGGSATSNAIELVATDTADGNVLIQGNGSNANNPSIELLADNDTFGQILLKADGGIADAIKVTATNGGVDIDAVGLVSINTEDLVNGIQIATGTAGVPVTIGTGTSTTNIAGNLIVSGSSTIVNTETLLVEDNIIVLNSGSGELDLDSGLLVKRFQQPNDTGVGNVTTGPNPIQESGVFQAGSATPGTLVLDEFTSGSDDFYKGWWIKIVSGTGNDQVRRIKSYVGATKTATLYVTADNNTEFNDGLDLVTAPAAGDAYNLYSDNFAVSYFHESGNRWTFANASVVPEAISDSASPSTVAIQQYQQINTGAHDIYPQVYSNAKGVASGNTITLTLKGHTLNLSDFVGISESTGFTPAIAGGSYVVSNIVDANTFEITVPDSTTSTASASVKLTDYYSSVLKVNVIQPFNPDFGPINIEGLSLTEDIIIPKESVAYFSLDTSSQTYGSVFILVSDLNNTDGAFSSFVGARSTAGTGTVSRLASARGADGQRIDADWEDTEKIKLRHRPAGSGTGNYTYRVRIFSI